MIVLRFTNGNGDKVRVAHDGPHSTAYLFSTRLGILYEGKVGEKVPPSWKEWNVLPSWRLTLTGKPAVARWAEVSR